MTIIGAMYAAVLFVGINNCSTVQPVVAVERTVFYRERAAGMYSALPYAMAQVKLPWVRASSSKAIRRNPSPHKNDHERYGLISSYEKFC